MFCYPKWIDKEMRQNGWVIAQTHTDGVDLVVFESL